MELQLALAGLGADSGPRGVLAVGNAPTSLQQMLRRAVAEKITEQSLPYLRYNCSMCMALRFANLILCQRVLHHSL